MYCGAVGYVCAVRDGRVVADGHVAADAGAAADCCAGADHGIGVDQAEVPHGAGLVDLGAGVDEDAVADGCAVLDQGVVQHNAAPAQGCIGADIGAGGNEIRECISQGRRPAVELRSEFIVADDHHQAGIVPAQLRQVGDGTDDGDAADRGANRGTVVHKGAVVALPGQLGDHPAEATGTHQQELFLRHWECPSARSGHTRWS